MRWCALFWLAGLALAAGTCGCAGLGPEVEVYFCPGDDCMGVVLGELAGAAESVHCAVYVITVEELAEMLAMKSMEEGVDVQVVVEGRYTGSRYSKYEYLKWIGVDIRVDGNKGDMHNKFCVIDGETVITGSANWSGNGMFRNDENIVIIRNRKVAEEYEKEFWVLG